ncbi:hypothetical protein H4Q26_011340 [Puccinia striiformis f. sp. tritici PST-130]|nr:hypothetical protein H4Q26_011340 [Puccinia striiformis f. sp. tritici PST-130]
MRWIANALIHSPTEYPLLTRTLDHFSDSSSADQPLKLLLHRILQPDILSVVTSWSHFNRANHFFIGQAFDLAVGSQSTQHLLDEGKALGHRSLLRLVIAACLPFRVLTPHTNLQSHVSKSITSEPFVGLASDAVLQACLLILGVAHSGDGLSTVELSDYQKLFESIGFALKIIDDSIDRAPIQWTSSFESTKMSLQPLRDSHDISRWEGLVLLWNLFCPSWYKDLHLVALVGQLETLAETNWSLLNDDLRAIYFEIAASLKISQEISTQCPDITWLTEKLKEQISTAKAEKSCSTEITPLDESFGIVGEKMIAIVATMASFLQPEQSDVTITSLLSQWGSMPSEVGVLFRSKAYLQDQNASTDHIDLCLNLQILMSLTASPINFCDGNKSSLGPFNILSQFTRPNFLQVISRITRLVKTSTSLERHGTVVNTLDQLVSHVATTTSCLTADRERLCHSLISNLLDFIEAPVVHIQGTSESQPSAILPTEPTLTSRALRLWKLYIPDVPIDPLSVQTAHHSYLQAWASRLSQLRGFLASYQQTKGGVQSNPRMSQLDEEISAIELRCKEIPQPSIQRSTDTMVQLAIFTELKAFEKQFLADGRVEDLAQALIPMNNQENLNSLHSWIENFSFSAIGLINRLSKRFPTTVDILWPVQALLHAMIADLTLSFQRAMATSSHPSTGVITELIKCLTTSTTAIAAANLRQNTLVEKLPSSVSNEASASNISLLCISAMTQYSIKEYDNSQVIKLFSFYDNIWQLWTRDCIRQQKEAEEKAQEFKTRRQDIIIKSDEEIEEEELQALFPSHEDNTPPSSSNASSNLVTPTQISILCKMFLSIMSGEIDDEHSRSSFDSLRQQIVVAIVERQGLSLPSLLDQSSLGFQFHSLCQLLESNKSPADARANFYTDSNTTETTRVVPLMKALALRINALIEQWPEMTTLDEILQRCQKIAALSSGSPLALIIPQLEALIGQIEEWQKYSCSENSLLSFQSELVTLVVSWRRLELRSWAALIQTEVDTFQSTTDPWWFRLYELLVRGYSTHAHSSETQEAKSYLKDCALVLDEFITACNLGQFGSRLALLKSFSALLTAASKVPDMGCWTPINNLLDGIIYFYAHYEPQVDQKIEKAKKLARGDIENYIQLASWKDVNIIALRQSSQKSHRQLYKTVRKFRNVLQGPVKDTLQRWQVKKSGEIEGSLPTILQPQGLPGRDDLDLLSWNRYTKLLSMPAYFSQPQNILKRLQKVVQSKGFLSQDVSTAASEMSLTSTHIFLVAKELSEVKIPPGDGRERFARNLDLRKRKAFSELLKKLRILGIGTSPTDRLLLQLSDPAVVMNMERLIGSIESGLALILAERQTLSALINTIKPIEQSISRMSSLLDTKILCTPNMTGHQLRDMTKRITQHQKLCGNAIGEASETIGQLGNRRQSRGPTAITDSLQEMVKSTAEKGLLVQDIAKVADTSLTLLKPDEAEGLRNVNSNFKGTTERLESLAAKFPEFDFILSPLARQLDNFSSTIPNFDGDDACSSEKAWVTLKKLTDLILVVIQDLAKSQESQIDSLKSKKAPGLLRKAHSEFVTFTGQCHLEEILQSLSTFNEALSLTSNSEEIFLLLNMAASLLQQYLQLISNHLLDYLRWHRSSLHLLHTVISIGANIAEQGFCKPDFSEQEEDGAGKDGPSRDGTGLGGGQGAKDVSDEIEDDEQLEEDKAVETQQDFDGELEDVKDADESDSNADEDGDDEEGDDEIEDGVGKVDPLDSGAVDEKFWEGGDDDGDEPETNEAELSAKENQTMPKDSDLTAKENTAGGEQNKAKKAEDQEMNSPEENEGADADDNLSGGEVEENDTDLQDEDPNAEEDENENDHQPPVHDSAVPMMEHVDNSEALDLPEDLELEDHGSEAGETPFRTRSWMLKILHPSLSSDATLKQPTDHNNDIDFQPEEAAGESQPQDDSAGKAEDSQIGAGAGTEGGGALSTPAALDQIENLDQGTDNEQPQMDGQEPADAPQEDSAKEKKLTQAVQPKSTEQVGDGTDGEAVSQQKGPTDHSDEAKMNNPAKPPAPDEGKDSGEERFDDTAEVDICRLMMTILLISKPRPCYGEQACEGLVNMQIDDCEPEPDIPRPPVSNSAPYPIEPLQAPEKGDQSDPTEAAILGRSLGHRRLMTATCRTRNSKTSHLSGVNTNNSLNAPLPHLTEQLRLILEPTTATCLQGDYRTGKRLNMRKLVPYIASDYTKDRIWLRRTKPAQRDYKILLAVDDSRSMADSRCADLAFQTLALVTSALSKLEVGEQQTNVRLAVAKAVEAFSSAQSSSNSTMRMRLGSWESSSQMAFVKITKNSENKDNHQNDSSIISMNSVSYVNGPNGAMELKMERYLDTFPFDYYIILRDVEALPNVLSSTLRQFLEKSRKRKV